MTPKTIEAMRIQAKKALVCSLLRQFGLVVDPRNMALELFASSEDIESAAVCIRAALDIAENTKKRAEEKCV